MGRAGTVTRQWRCDSSLQARRTQSTRGQCSGIENRTTTWTWERAAAQPGCLGQLFPLAAARPLVILALAALRLRGAIRAARQQAFHVSSAAVAQSSSAHNSPATMPRRVTKLFNARQQTEGAGFIVRRPIGAVHLCALRVRHTVSSCARVPDLTERLNAGSGELSDAEADPVRMERRAWARRRAWRCGSLLSRPPGLLAVPAAGRARPEDLPARRVRRFAEARSGFAGRLPDDPLLLCLFATLLSDAHTQARPGTLTAVSTRSRTSRRARARTATRWATRARCMQATCSG